MRKTSSKNTPQTVRMTPEEAQALRARIQNASLPDEDVTTLLGLISFCLWMQEKILNAKLRIKHLRKFFGFKREKNTEKKNKDEGENQDATDNHVASEEPASSAEQTSDAAHDISDDANQTDGPAKNQVLSQNFLRRMKTRDAFPLDIVMPLMRRTACIQAY